VNQPPAVRQDAIRRHNLALVLRQIHVDGALTRAELTQRSGLSRSTIGTLVAELSDRDLLSESVPTGGSGVGRPSHVVGPRPDSPYVVAVDIDVTRVVIAAVGIGGLVQSRHVSAAPTGPVTPEGVAGQIADALPSLQAAIDDDARPVGLGVSVPGVVERFTGRVPFAPNLGWHDVPLQQLIQAAVPHLPVSVGNDADLAVLSEHVWGSARGFEDVVYLLGRIGVGAGILTDGRPLRGAGGLAGEVGHTVLDPAGPPCHCGSRGCVETFVGDAALLRLTHGEGSVQDILRAADQGEPAAMAAVEVLAEALGRTAANIVNLLNPQLIVFGGSLRTVLTRAQAHVEAALDGPALSGAREMVELRPCLLGEDGPLLGAAQLAFGPLLTDPLGALDALSHEMAGP
jgi:predicted NBD/HSP70 family sugar kinase